MKEWNAIYARRNPWGGHSSDGVIQRSRMLGRQRWAKRRALGCEKFLPGPAWLLLSNTGPPFSPSQYVGPASCDGANFHRLWRSVTPEGAISFCPRATLYSSKFAAVFWLGCLSVSNSETLFSPAASINKSSEVLLSTLLLRGTSSLSTFWLYLSWRCFNLCFLVTSASLEGDSVRSLAVLHIAQWILDIGGETVLCMLQT